MSRLPFAISINPAELDDQDLRASLGVCRWGTYGCSDSESRVKYVTPFMLSDL